VWPCLWRITSYGCTDALCHFYVSRVDWKGPILRPNLSAWPILIREGSPRKKKKPCTQWFFVKFEFCWRQIGGGVETQICYISQPIWRVAHFELPRFKRVRQGTHPEEGFEPRAWRSPLKVAVTMPPCWPTHITASFDERIFCRPDQRKERKKCWVMLAAVIVFTASKSTATRVYFSCFYLCQCLFDDYTLSCTKMFFVPSRSQSYDRKLQRQRCKFLQRYG
jgi:hypothetical protein